MSLMCIRLELARTPEFPNGSSRHGYEFIAPLTKEGHIDLAAWKANRQKCVVTRFWGDNAAEDGMLAHVENGWRFDYAPGEDSDDEPFFKLDKHALVPGTYVSVTEHDGKQYPFKVTEVLPIQA